MKTRIHVEHGKGDLKYVQLLPTPNTDEELKTLGELYGTTLVTLRDPAKHLMKKWNAYGFNAELIDSGIIDVIVILFPAGMKRKVVTVEDIKTQGQLQHPEGHEPQYFIGVEHLSDAE